MTFGRSPIISSNEFASTADARGSDWKLWRLIVVVLSVLSTNGQAQSAWPRPPKFRVVALAERGGGDHQKFVDAAKLYLNKLAAENDFAVDHLSGTERINEESLAQYKLFIQLNYPPYRWAPTA